MSEDELKDNKCKLMFYCDHSPNDECVFYRSNGKNCKYLEDSYFICNSAVARVNKMTIETKKLKGR